MEPEDLEQHVKDLTAHLDSLTAMVGEGRTSEGLWVADLGPRGIMSHCSLAVKRARGATVESGGSDVVGTTCTYFRCTAAEHLAICYYCHQPGCPNHRVLIAGYRSEKTSASASGAFPRIS